MFKVITAFYDAQDGHLYNVGDTYPREGAKPTKTRLAELASEKNAAGVPLIEEVKEKPAK
jgi:hypothetical protein